MRQLYQLFQLNRAVSLNIMPNNTQIALVLKCTAAVILTQVMNLNNIDMN